MPLIEVIPTQAGSTSAPGWAYVPDTGLDPVKAGHVPQNPRKRAAAGRAVGAGGADRTARQQAALQKRLADLDRDNARDVNVAIPSRPQKDGGARAPKGKTPATRRILLAQKTFANYLADDEALAAQQDSGNAAAAALPLPRAVTPPSNASKNKTAPAAGAKRRVSGAPALADKDAAREKPSSRGKNTANASDQNDVVMKDEEPGGVSDVAALPDQSSLASYYPPPPPPPPLSPASSYLLRTAVPTAPSDALLAALIAMPPLSYQAARAPTPPASAPPMRYFCIMCGRWGRVRCIGCGERVCGVDCSRAHGDGCVGLGGRR